MASKNAYPSQTQRPQQFTWSTVEVIPEYTLGIDGLKIAKSP